MGDLWGCLECGALSEARNAAGRCAACDDGLVVALDGSPSAEGAQALLAWARRDATDTLEGRGTAIGAVIGTLLAVAAAGFLTAIGPGVLLLLLYLAVLGALAGRGLSLPLHRRLRPHSRLQPAFDLGARRRLFVAIVVWLLAGLLAAALIAGTDARTPGEFMRQLLRSR